MRWLPESRLRRGVAIAALLGCLAVPVLGWTWCLHMPSRSHHGPLPARSPQQVALAARLRTDVEHLAGAIGERNTLLSDELARAADFLTERLRSLGYEPRRQSFEVQGVACHNIEVELAGTTHPSEIVIAGAHYDSAPGTAGANDNASGTAALLALAAEARSLRPAKTLRLVWFVNEEPPWFQGPDMGSLRYAERAAAHGERIVAMLSLETMGFYTDAPDTQHYPGPLAAFYPSTGNFIAFVGNLSSRDLLRRALGVFRQSAQFPSEGAALPAGLPGVGWSDHWAFWQHGYPAIMVTDTAPFRYPHYHLASDTPDKLDYVRLARVVEGLGPVLVALTGADAR
jgi:hypothetical protein